MADALPQGFESLDARLGEVEGYLHLEEKDA